MFYCSKILSFSKYVNRGSFFETVEVQTFCILHIETAQYVCDPIHGLE